MPLNSCARASSHEMLVSGFASISRQRSSIKAFCSSVRSSASSQSTLSNSARRKRTSCLSVGVSFGNSLRMSILLIRTTYQRASFWQAGPCLKNLRAAGLLLLGFVVARVSRHAGTGILRPLRLAQNQNPSPQHGSQFSDGGACDIYLPLGCGLAGRRGNVFANRTSWATLRIFSTNGSRANCFRNASFITMGFSIYADAVSFPTRIG